MVHRADSCLEQRRRDRYATPSIRLDPRFPPTFGPDEKEAARQASTVDESAAKRTYPAEEVSTQAMMHILFSFHNIFPLAEAARVRISTHCDTASAMLGDFSGYRYYKESTIISRRD
jgi:hypothetical protein